MACMGTVRWVRDICGSGGLLFWCRELEDGYGRGVILRDGSRDSTGWLGGRETASDFP